MAGLARLPEMRVAVTLLKRVLKGQASTPARGTSSRVEYDKSPVGAGFYACPRYE